VIAPAVVDPNKRVKAGSIQSTPTSAQTGKRKILVIKPVVVDINKGQGRVDSID
jgi:hypothetical protein